MSDNGEPDDPRSNSGPFGGWPFRWVDAPEQRASRERLAALEAARRRNHDRHWPRDAPLRWGSLLGGLVWQLVSIVALIVHFGLGLVYVVVLLSDRVEGAGEWMLALTWAVLCVYAVREWLFGRITVVLAPVVSAILLVAVAGWHF